MRKLFAIFALLLSAPALAQFSPGQVLTAAQLNSQFALYAPKAGATFTGAVTVPALSVTGVATLPNVAISGGTITGLSAPIPIASGGTNAASASGTALDNISGFASTGFLTRTGAGAYSFQSLTNGITLGNLAQAAANTVLANATSATANVAAFSMPGCSATTNALTWTTSTGFTCNSAINAATLGGATFAAPGPIGATTPSTGSFTTLAASGTVSGTGFTNYFASPPPIGSTTANTGKFTTLGANSSSVAFTFTSPGGVPTVGGVGAIAGTATLGQVNDGSTGSPHTALTPSVAITRNEAVNSASLSGNSPALWVEVVGNNSGAGNPNSNALEAVATQNGTGDAVGLVGWGIQSGTSGHYAYGGFFNGQATVANTNAFAIETVTTNATGTNQPLVVGNVPPMVGLHIDAGSNNTSTSALWVSKDTGAGSGQWDSGLYFSPSSIVTYAVIDESSSANSIFIGGTHQYGLNMINGTYTGNAIQATGFNVSNSGAVSGISFSPSTTAGIIGTTTNNSANAGSVGEYISATTLTTSVSNGVQMNAASISLTAGDWDVSGVVRTTPAGTTTVQQQIEGISTTSATLGAFGTFTNDTYATAAGVGEAHPTPVVRISLASTTTVFLVASISFANSTCTVDGLIRARRVR